MKRCWSCFLEEYEEWCGKINLVCDKCSRFYCENGWTEANDEISDWPKGEDGLHHMPRCDVCTLGCRKNTKPVDGHCCSYCFKTRKYFSNYIKKTSGMSISSIYARTGKTADLFATLEQLGVDLKTL